MFSALRKAKRPGLDIRRSGTHVNVTWKWKPLDFALRDPWIEEMEESASHHLSIICFALLRAEIAENDAREARRWPEIIRNLNCWPSKKSTFLMPAYDIWHGFWRDWILFFHAEIYSLRSPDHVIFKLEMKHAKCHMKWKPLQFAGKENYESALHHLLLSFTLRSCAPKSIKKETQ